MIFQKKQDFIVHISGDMQPNPHGGILPKLATESIISGENLHLSGIHNVVCKHLREPDNEIGIVET